MKKIQKLGSRWFQVFLVFTLIITSAIGYLGGITTVYGEENPVGPVLKIDQEYAEIGQPLTATLTGVSEDVTCKFEWQVNGKFKSSENSYVPTSEDLEKMLVVTAKVTGDNSATYWIRRVARILSVKKITSIVILEFREIKSTIPQILRCMMARLKSGAGEIVHGDNQKSHIK